MLKTTAAEFCRENGLDSLAEMSKICGVPYRTLTDWHKTKPITFKVLLIGCVSIKRNKENG